MMPGSSHEAGGVDMMDKGKKVGEIEGGERIFSGDATLKMDGLAKENKYEELGKFVAAEIERQDTGEESFEKAKGGKFWIQGAIKKEGSLKEKAKEMGLLKSSEDTLSGTDLDKLEALGGIWAKRAALARTLSKF